MKTGRAQDPHWKPAPAPRDTSPLHSWNGVLPGRAAGAVARLLWAPPGCMSLTVFSPAVACRSHLPSTSLIFSAQQNADFWQRLNSRPGI